MKRGYVTIWLHIVLFAAVAMLSCGFAEGETGLLTKAFTVKFKNVDEVASLINPMLSEQGAITWQPRLRTLVVQDYEKNLRLIESAVLAFDTPPPSVEVSVKLVQATKGARDLPVSDEIRNISKVGEILKFDQFSLLDSGLIESEEGQLSELTLAKDYQLNFLSDVIQEGNGIIRLKNFQLRKRKKDTDGKDVYIPLITVTLNLRNEETLVLGASRFEESDRALLVVLLAKVKK